MDKDEISAKSDTARTRRYCRMWCEVVVIRALEDKHTYITKHTISQKLEVQDHGMPPGQNHYHVIRLLLQVNSLTDHYLLMWLLSKHTNGNFLNLFTRKEKLLHQKEIRLYSSSCKRRYFLHSVTNWIVEIRQALFSKLSSQVFSIKLGAENNDPPKLTLKRQFEVSIQVF